MASSSSPVRVRFAPSPTGLLHIGGLRTALYNYLFARQHGGTFILRIEDTDRSRYMEEAEGDIIRSLSWAGLTYEEGPVVGGEGGPYYQSMRQPLYQQYVRHLLDERHAYYAFDTEEDLTAMRERRQAAGEAAPAYDASVRRQLANSLSLSDDEVQQRLDRGEPYVVRLKVAPGRTVRFDDRIRGTVAIDTAEVDDQVLLKSDGMPTYHLANVVDDHLMGITHVIRGEEWLPSTPKHILLYEAFGWTPPEMAHLPLILSPTGGKLSKRNADKLGIPVSVQQYVADGYEPEALVNFLALLGWNPGTEQELFDLEELVAAFSLERVGSSGVQFNLDKLRWYNEQHLRALATSELAHRTRADVEAAGFNPDEDYLVQAVELMKERITFPADVAEQAPYLFQAPETYDAKAVKKQWKDATADLLRGLAERLAGLASFEADALEAEVKAYVKEQEVGFGKVMAPLRLALTGTLSGPGVYEMMALFGRDGTLARIHAAVETLG